MFVVRPDPVSRLYPEWPAVWLTEQVWARRTSPEVSTVSTQQVTHTHEHTHTLLCIFASKKKCIFHRLMHRTRSSVERGHESLVVRLNLMKSPLCIYKAMDQQMVQLCGWIQQAFLVCNEFTLFATSGILIEIPHTVYFLDLLFTFFRVKKKKKRIIIARIKEKRGNNDKRQHHHHTGTQLVVRSPV